MEQEDKERTVGIMWKVLVVPNIIKAKEVFPEEDWPELERLEQENELSEDGAKLTEFNFSPEGKKVLSGVLGQYLGGDDPRGK